MPFSPWNESERPPVLEVVVTASMIDTTQVDAYRQGVELRTSGDLFLATQPKFWGGSITRYGKLDHGHVDGPEPAGAPGSWTHYSGSVKWTDRSPRWTPVGYLRSRATFAPGVVLVGDGAVVGPQTVFEGVMMPLDINGRKGIPEDPRLLVHQVGGDAVLTKATLSPWRVPPGPGGPYLDVSACRTGSLRPAEGWWNPSGGGVVSPFHDEDEDRVVGTLTGVSGKFRTDLIGMEINLHSDVRVRNVTERSATSGRDVYGPGQARTGTDSVAFAGTFRGS